MKKALTILTIASALISGLLGLSTLLELVPASHAAFAGSCFLILYAVLKCVLAVGDALDDGALNGSFGVPPPLPPPPVTKQAARVWPPLVPLVLLMLCLSGCVSADSSRRELMAAEFGLSAARVALEVAATKFAGVSLKNTAPVWQTVAARVALNEAAAVVARESARVEMLRNAPAVLPLPLLSPNAPQSALLNPFLPSVAAH